MAKRGRRKLTEAVIEANRERVANALASFGGQRNADSAAFSVISHSIFTSRMKPMFKDMVQKDKQAMIDTFGVNPYLSEAKKFGKYRFALSTIALHVIGEDWTNLQSVLRPTFEIMDRQFMPQYFRTLGTMDSPLRGVVPTENARFNSSFKKKVIQELIKADKYGHIEFDQEHGRVRRNVIIPVTLAVDFWGNILHTAGYSFRDSMITTKVALHHTDRQELPVLMVQLYGRDYGFKSKDSKKWWKFFGKDGTQLAFEAPLFLGRGTFLQYSKAGIAPNWKKEESEAYHRVMGVINSMPYVKQDMVKTIVGADVYADFIKACSKKEELFPMIIDGSFVSPELGNLLQWQSPDNLNLDQHGARYTLSGLYDKINPSEKDVEELGKTVFTILSRLAAEQEFKPTTPMEESVIGSLDPYLTKLENNLYTVNPGMVDNVIAVSRYTGNLFAGKKSK